MALITVEFFGIPRERVQVPSCQIEATQLADALLTLQARYPVLSGECLRGASLAPGYLIAVNAREFTRDVNTPLTDGDSLQLLAADVGG